jgi:hypothetical protein
MIRLPFARALAAAGALAALAVAAPAHAQSTVEAEKLFRDGKTLMKQGKFAEACEAFGASQRMESNVATLMSLADCLEKNGQLASAWGYFLKAESETRADRGKGQVNATARRRAAALEPRLSYLTINVPDESRVEGLVVSRGGAIIDPGTYNRALPIDGGEHEITGKAPGHEGWSTKVTVATESDRQSVEVPKFKELPKLLEPTPPVGPSPVLTAPAPSPWTPTRKAALGVGVGSAVALGAGIFLGVRANALENEAKDQCPRGECSLDDVRWADRKRERANSHALGANVAFGVSAAAAIGAGVLWYLGAPDGGDAPADDLGDGSSDDAGDESAFRLHPHVGEFTGVTLDARF